MNFRQMEIFHAVMLRGSVTGAARFLGLTQPAVTKILRHTEDSLKIRLFNRIKGRLVPTDDAVALFPDVERVFDEISAVRQTLSDVRSVRSGALRIATIPTLGEVALPRAVAAFIREHPGVSITFEVRPRRSVVQAVATQRAELGFAFLAEDHANVDRRPLCSGGMVCLLPPGHGLAARSSLTFADLVGQPMIGYSSGQAMRPIIEARFAAERAPLVCAIEVAWVATAWAMVDKGVGLALVDSFSQLDRLYPGVIVRPLTPHIEIQADVLTPRGRPLSRLGEEFMRVALRVLSAGGDA